MSDYYKEGKWNRNETAVAKNADRLEERGVNGNVPVGGIRDPQVSGPGYEYLGHFAKPENVKRGHNDVSDMDADDVMKVMSAGGPAAMPQLGSASALKKPAAAYRRGKNGKVFPVRPKKPAY